VSEGLKKTEAECAEGRTAPRVKLDDILKKIAYTQFVNGTDILPKALPLNTAYAAQSLKVLTVCFVVMDNGFTIIGKSAPASPENFDPELGKKLAHEDAVRQIWPLMGFALREHLK
jgi:hypothetical protein